MMVGETILVLGMALEIYMKRIYIRQFMSFTQPTHIEPVS